MDIVTDCRTTFELEEVRPEVGFLPIGATEEHSRHLPLATDTMLGDLLSERVLGAVDRAGTAFLMRTLPISSSEENMGYWGTVSLSPMTMRGILRDTYDSLSKNGIPRLVVCPWHGGNFILKPATRELNLELGKCGVIFLNPWEHVPAEAYAEFASGFEVHAGDVETSIMLALCPEHVRDDRRDNPIRFNPIWQDMLSMKTLSGGEGHCGHPSQATAEKGKAFVAEVVKHTAAYLTEILALADKHDSY